MARPPGALHDRWAHTRTGAVLMPLIILVAVALATIIAAAAAANAKPGGLSGPMPLDV